MIISKAIFTKARWPRHGARSMCCFPQTPDCKQDSWNWAASPIVLGPGCRSASLSLNCTSER